MQARLWISFCFLASVLTSGQAFGEWPSFVEPILKEVRQNYPDIYIRYNLENESVAASADFDGVVKSLTVYGGLVQSPRLSPDVFRMVLCHEIGHIEGKDPRKNVPPEWDGPVAPDGLSFLSSEGQADYFAALECFPRLAQGQDHASVLQPEKITPRLKQICADDLCLRSSVAAFDFLRLVHDFEISFETPDLSVTPELIRDSYPDRQCRLDTFVAGAMKADRPSCWFR